MYVNVNVFPVDLHTSLTCCACFCNHPAPNIQNCEFVSSSNNSLTFRWPAVKSATSYRLEGHSMTETFATNSITVDDLTPGSYYTFTVTAIGSTGLESNSIACTNSTSESTFRFCQAFIELYHVLSHHYIVLLS